MLVLLGHGEQICDMGSELPPHGRPQLTRSAVDRIPYGAERLVFPQATRS
jgi:hypothetical protein